MLSWWSLRHFHGEVAVEVGHPCRQIYHYHVEQLYVARHPAADHAKHLMKYPHGPLVQLDDEEVGLVLV